MGILFVDPEFESWGVGWCGVPCLAGQARPGRAWSSLGSGPCLGGGWAVSICSWVLK